MLLHATKITWSKVVVIMTVVYFSNAVNAHNKVVVIPLFDDIPPRVYAPMKTDEAPRADYFILSETARDLVTGLEWQRNESTFSHNWHDARVICRNLALGGHADWRLPTIKELIGITDYTRASPALSVQAFPSPKTALDYWSSTIDPSVSTLARTVDVSNGGVVNSEITSSRYVRCVRAGTSNGSTFVNNNDGTVQDLSFGLMWERDTYSHFMSSFSQANIYCQELDLGGFSDWRMPSVKELTSLLEFRVSVEINSAFSFDVIHYRQQLYTKTTNIALAGSENAWAVRFNHIHEFGVTLFSVPKAGFFRTSVKCVRNTN